MAYRVEPFVTNNFYHIYNRGVEKRLIFRGEKDFNRFYKTLYYYQFSGPKPKFSTYKRFRNYHFEQNPKIVEIICFVFMPNHFHLVVRQLKDGGIHEFLQKVGNSYAKYYNNRHKRVGPLFQGQFKSVAVESEYQLLHLSRYIHLNPFVSSLVTDAEKYQYSSYIEYLSPLEFGICANQLIMDFFKNINEYKNFVNNHKDYAKNLHLIRQLTHEI